jgi:hypothetical protein
MEGRWSCRAAAFTCDRWAYCCAFIGDCTVIAGDALATEALVAEISEPKSEAPQHGGGGMGGMY